MTVIAIALSVLSIAAALTVFRKVRDSKVSKGRILAIAVLCLAPTFSIVFAAVSGQRWLVADGAGGVAFESNENWALSNGLKVAVIVVLGLFAFVDLLRTRRVSNPGLFLIGVAGTFALLGGGLVGGTLVEGRTGLFLLVIFVVAVMNAKEAFIYGVAAFAILLTGLSALLMLSDPALVILECRTYKCGPLGFLFAGVFNNENQLAIPLVLSIPFILSAFRGVSRVTVLAPVLFVIVISGSRTSTIAALAFLAAFIIVSRLPVGIKIKSRILAGAAIPFFLLSLVLILASPPANFATGRGRLWGFALDEWERSPLIGVGVYEWSDLLGTGVVNSNAGSTPSNLWADLLMVSGVLGAVLVMAVFWGRYLLLSGHSKLHFAAALLLVSLVGIAESPLIIADFSSPHSYFAVAVLAAFLPDNEEKGSLQMAVGAWRRSPRLLSS